MVHICDLANEKEENMYKNVLDVLQCPKCKKKLVFDSVTEQKGEEIVQGTLKCLCNHTYRIYKGIIDFNSVEQDNANSWSEYYKDTDYETLDKEIEARKSDEFKKNQETFLQGILDEVCTLKEGFVLDVASGRGMLLGRLISRINEKVHVIATDLSFEVLMYDRIKFSDINPNVKVTYIACDATNLPIQEKSIDVVTTFVGFANMFGLIEQGIEEASRIVKQGGCLVDSIVYIKRDNPYFDDVDKMLSEHGFAGVTKYYTSEVELELHDRFFQRVEEKLIYEGIAEEVEGDILPIPGEWFGYAVVLGYN